MQAAGRLRILPAGYAHRTASIRLRADLVRKQADIGCCEVDGRSALLGAIGIIGKIGNICRLLVMPLSSQTVPKQKSLMLNGDVKDFKVVNVVKVLNILNVIKDNKSPAQAGI